MSVLKLDIWQIKHFFRLKLNQDDIVPHVPPVDVGYVHHPVEIWDLSNYSDHQQHYVVCDAENGEDPHCSKSVPPLRW